MKSTFDQEQADHRASIRSLQGFTINGMTPFCGSPSDTVYDLTRTIHGLCKVLESAFSDAEALPSNDDGMMAIRPAFFAETVNAIGILAALAHYFGQAPKA
jgi:hypothetical protein